MFYSFLLGTAQNNNDNAREIWKLIINVRKRIERRFDVADVRYRRFTNLLEWCTTPGRFTRGKIINQNL